ncbi:MAG: hypothetical protein V4609_01870 [Pseudomonadota bacterium]
MQHPTTPTPTPGAPAAAAHTATPLGARPPTDPGDAELRHWRASIGALEASLQTTLSTSLLPPREHARLAALAKAARCARDVLASPAA